MSDGGISEVVGKQDEDASNYGWIEVRASHPYGNMTWGMYFIARKLYGLVVMNSEIF